MEPAFELALNQKQLALVGEITAIFSQVDKIMLGTVERVLQINSKVANEIMGSTSFDKNGKIWSSAISNRSLDPTILKLTEIARKELLKTAMERADFVHASFENVQQPTYFGPRYFGRRYFGAGYFGAKPVLTAKRIKGGRSRPVGALQATRDRVARLSCLVAHIDYLLHGPAGTQSPWFQRLKPILSQF